MTERLFQRQETKIGDGAGTVVLLLLLLASVTGSIDAANWTDGLGVVTWAVLGGFLLGMLLAKSPARGMVSHAAMLLLGVPAALFSASLLLPDTLTTGEKLIVLQQRFQFWYDQVSSGKYGNDALVFVIQLAFLLWIVAYAASWFVFRRHQAWGAIVPIGIALFVNLFYAEPQSGLYLAVYLLCSLLLLVRMNLRALELWWRGAAIGYTSDINFDFLVYGSVFALMMIAVAWFVPPSAPGPSWLTFLDPLETPWQDVEKQFTRIFNTLNAVARPAAPATFFGTSLAMGGPVHLGTRPVMDIRTEFGRYWRAAVYDQYTGTGWIDTQTDILNLGANDPRLDTGRDLLRADVTQSVQIILPDQDILYAEAQPIRFPDLPTEVRYLTTPPNSGIDPDLTLVRSRRPLRSGDTYAVVSSISVADQDSLRAAPTQYSDWMVKTFIQMPAAMPMRVHNLALQITQGATNPFDAAIDIEEFLRTNIKYNESVTAPPPGRDGVDYTLFDRREGYCNYYASAMAVLARQVGIPARVASGYALGDYKDGVFHVIEANAHSWPELYFPNYGWISFEPTASQPDIVWPAKARVNPNLPDRSGSDVKPPGPPKGNVGAEKGSDGASGLFFFDSTFWNSPTNVGLAAAGLVALLIASSLGLREWRHTRLLARLAPAAHVYEKMLDRAHWIGIRDQKFATPLERAGAIGFALPEVRAEVDQVASFYTREKFGAQGLNAVESAALAKAWDKFRNVWRRALLHRSIDRIVTPPRQFATRVRVRLDHWGGNLPR